MNGQDYKKLIKNSGLKQNFIASKIGVHPVTLNNFLNEKAKLNDLKLHSLQSFIFSLDTKEN